MDPVKTNAETFGSNVASVSSALTTFAAEIEPIKAELARIKAEAEDFVVSIAGGVEKKTYSRAGVHTSTIEWHEDQDSVDANNALIGRVNEQMVLLWAAERKCANAIYDIIGFPHVEAATDANPNGYGVTEIPEGAETPWGAAVERSESCGEQALGAVKGFVWDGVVVGGIWGTVEGLGSLVLGYNPQTGEWFDGDTYGAAWSNLGMLAVGLASTGLVTSAAEPDGQPGRGVHAPGPADFAQRRQGPDRLGQVAGRPGRRRGRVGVQRRHVDRSGGCGHGSGTRQREHRRGRDPGHRARRRSHRSGLLGDQGWRRGHSGGSAAGRRSGEIARSRPHPGPVHLGGTGTRIDLPDFATTPTRIDVPDAGGADITVTSPRAEADISVPVRDVDRRRRRSGPRAGAGRRRRQGAGRAHPDGSLRDRR